MPLQIRHLIPMLHVADVPQSIAFYERFGFRVMNTHRAPGAPAPTWAWLENDPAQLMLARASAPVVPEQQAVLFYLYVDDVARAKAALKAAGIETGPIESHFYSPDGEFRVVDPDGYALMVTHA